MNTPLYQKCPACDGTRKAVRPMMVDGLAVKGMTGTYSGPIGVGYPCPCCTDGYTESGFTLEQAQMYFERDLKARTKKVEKMGVVAIAPAPPFDGTYQTTGDKRATITTESVPGQETK